MTYGLADVVQQRRLIEMSEADGLYKRLSGAKLDSMLGLAEAADCRRARLLAYFNEASAPCGNCDNCLAPPERTDATEAARKLLSCIYRCERGSGFGFAATHIIDVLRGKPTEKVAKFGHERLSTFGIGTELSEAQWRLLLRHLIAQHIVDVDHSTFNVLRLTEDSRAVLRGERTIELRQPSAEPRRRSSKQRASHSAADDPMFEKLRAWRARVAKEHGLPAFVVFHDDTLRAIAQSRPTSLSQLRGISGIGEKKLASYGADVLKLMVNEGA